MAGFDRLHLIDEHVVDLRVMGDQVIVGFEPVFRGAFVNFLHIFRIDAFKKLVVRFGRFRIDRRVAAAQFDRPFLHFVRQQVFDPLERFLRVLGVFQNQQRIDKQRAAHLLVAAPRHCGYARLERKIVGPGQVPGAADGHPDLPGDERIAVLAGHAFAPFGRGGHFVLENQPKQFIVGRDHLRRIEIRFRRDAAVGPGVRGVRLRAEVKRAHVAFGPGEIDAVLRFGDVVGDDRQLLGVLDHFVERPALVLEIAGRIRDARGVEHILVVEHQRNVDVYRNAVGAALDLVNLHQMLGNAVVGGVKAVFLHQIGQVEQHVFVVVFGETAVAVMARDIGRVAAGDQRLQLAVELLVGRFFHFDFNIRVGFLEFRDQLLDKRPVGRIDRVVRDGHLPGAAGVAGAAPSVPAGTARPRACAEVARRFAPAAGRQDGRQKQDRSQ